MTNLRQQIKYRFWGMSVSRANLIWRVVLSVVISVVKSSGYATKINAEKLGNLKW
jgi:hypothetical protein